MSYNTATILITLVIKPLFVADDTGLEPFGHTSAGVFLTTSHSLFHRLRHEERSKLHQCLRSYAWATLVYCVLHCRWNSSQPKYKGYFHKRNIRCLLEIWIHFQVDNSILTLLHLYIDFIIFKRSFKISFPPNISPLTSKDTVCVHKRRASLSLSFFRLILWSKSNFSIKLSDSGANAFPRTLTGDVKLRDTSM